MCRATGANRRHLLLVPLSVRIFLWQYKEAKTDLELALKHSLRGSKSNKSRILTHLLPLRLPALRRESLGRSSSNHSSIAKLQVVRCAAEGHDHNNSLLLVEYFNPIRRPNPKIAFVSAVTRVVQKHLILPNSAPTARYVVRSSADYLNRHLSGV